MSGIFGYLYNDAAKPLKIDMERMLRWNLAYGGEGDELFEETGLGIGCAYEKISPLSKKSAPVLSCDGKVAVIDALIYNREELMKKCGTIKVLSDEELLFQYIEQFGTDGLREVNGEFSGAIYDENNKSLRLFRDHMGVRPLFYYVKDSLVAFSTDIRGLIAVPQVDASMNEEWIYRTISGYMSGGVTATEFQHIFCVDPGTVIAVAFENNNIFLEKKCYWKIGQKKIRFSSEKEYVDKLRELVEDAIKRRLDASPELVGAELSGGLDSGVIDILIHRFGRDAVYFSWSPDPKDVPYADGDERLVVKDICEQENIRCKYRKKQKGYVIQNEMLERMKIIHSEIDTEEHPAFSCVLPPYINTLPICDTAQYARECGARVIFTGHGGDEGVSHRCNAYELLYHHEYIRFMRQMWMITEGQKRRVWKYLKQCGKFLLKIKRKYRKAYCSPLGTGELLKEEFKRKFDEKQMAALTFSYDPANYIRNGGSRNRLDVVALLGAYCGVRYIAPYLDYRVVDFAVSIPRHLYLRGKQNRYIFREAFHDIMPESLYTLRCKADNSDKNVEKNPNWFEEYSKQREDVFRRLDKEYWKEYLDFDRVEQWVRRGKMSEEEHIHEGCILNNLFLCATLENLVKKTREDN